MYETHSISMLIRDAAQRLANVSPTPRLDAELLLGHVLGWNRSRVLAEARVVVDSARRAAFQELVARRLELEPVAYLVGHREFYGLDFLVDRRVLVPRPETELLVEQALRLAQRIPAPQIADICTGSGCIAVALASTLPHAHVEATDLSADALDVARMNVERHHLAERITLRQGDLLAPLSGPVDLLVSNPPYTLLDTIDEGVRRHEPHLALDGGFDGLDLYRRLLAQAPQYVKRGGAVVLEIGATQGRDVQALAEAHVPGAQISVLRDLAGLDRVVLIETPD